MKAALWIYWISVVAMVGVYAGYPLLLWFIAKIRPRAVHKENFEPLISVLISAHNEEDDIGATIENKLTLNYPPEKIEVLVTSDGSTDQTEEIVSSFADRGVRLLVQNPRQGKTAALNEMARQARGEILIFSDANSIYDREALREIVANFSDENVGYVTGKMVYVDDRGSLVGSGCSAYMRYENVLRSLETKVGSLVGVDGGIDAVRRSLYEPMGAEVLPDFVLPLTVVKKGKRVVYEPLALLKEEALSKANDEWKMRIRVILRSFHAIWLMRGLLNPVRFGIYAAQLFLHKVMRYMVGVFQVMAFVTNFFLMNQGPWYESSAYAQILFYVFALGGYFMKESETTIEPFTYAYYFCLLNGASLLAFVKFLKGERQVIWQPRKG